MCLVDKKVAKRRLRRASHLIPPAMEWSIARAQRHEIATDVQELDGPFRHASVYGPGDAIQCQERATIGIALEHDVYGPVLTTAGHLTLNDAGIQIYQPGQEPNVVLAAHGGGGSVSGTVLKAVCSESADYALVRTAAGALCENIYDRQTPIGAPYRPVAHELNQPLFVLSARGVLNTTFRGIHGQVPVSSTRNMRELLLTDFISLPGDSGSCLVDMQFRVWGLLVGASTIEGTVHSVFMPADIPGHQENALFI